jgi:hypothetical protein
MGVRDRRTVAAVAINANGHGVNGHGANEEGSAANTAKMDFCHPGCGGGFSARPFGQSRSLRGRPPHSGS